MKTRTCFVSNSSSSSFVGFVTLEAHKKVLATLNDAELAFIKKLGIDVQKKMGRHWVCVSEVHDRSDSFVINNTDASEDPNLEIWKKYMTLLKEEEMLVGTVDF